MKQKDDNVLPAEQGNSPITDRKQLIFTFLFIGIAVLSIALVMLQSRDFSLPDFMRYVKSASPVWLIVSLLSMLGFIFFEAFAILTLCRAFGAKKSLWNGYIYSASDIYFSAITPSATGGQPASAYFMVKDGINGMMATSILVANIGMYTLAIIFVGIVCLLFKFDVFLRYSTVSQILIIIGLFIQIALFIFFWLLLKKDHLLQKICNGGLNLLCKLRVIRNKEHVKAKLDAYMDKYRKYSHLITGQRKALTICFIFNLLQRLAQMSVTLFVFMATTGKGISAAIDLLFMQGYVTLGANCIPIPGAMGISDYLMLDGFGSIMEESQAVNLELLSRTFSFYSCVIICGVSVLIQYCIIKRRGKN